MVKEDGIGEGGCVTTSPHPSHPLDNSLHFFAMAVKYFSSAPLLVMPLLGPGVGAPGVGLRRWG